MISQYMVILFPVIHIICHLWLIIYHLNPLTDIDILVAGDWNHGILFFFLFSWEYIIILTDELIFFRGVENTNQLWLDEFSDLHIQFFSDLHIQFFSQGKFSLN
jgi:hypothetical protein